MRLSIIAKAIGAQFHGQDREMPNIAIDSRKISGGEWFVALKGEKFDGHDFIPQALAAGAKAILSQRDLPKNLAPDISFMKVADTSKALGDLASFWRTRYPIPMVGITGSCGKTTVKGMVETICRHHGRTLATQGNFNNQFGLPLTLLALEPNHQFAVIEMGASAVGEIRYLGEIAKPNIALITNVAPAHIEGFGSIENVATAKSEIYEILPSDGIAILNVDDPFCDFFRSKIEDRRCLTFSLHQKADVFAQNIQMAPFHVEFTLVNGNEKYPVKINIPGQHTVMNALAALCASLALKIPLSSAVNALESFEGVPGRLRRMKGANGAWIIDDSYNANPRSVQAALDVLAKCEGDKIFVMGDMAELGDETTAYHAFVGEYARTKGIKALMAVGRLSEHAVLAFGEGAKVFPSKENLVKELKPLLHPQSVILVKGSRSSGMDVVSKALSEGS